MHILGTILLILLTWASGSEAACTSNGAGVRTAANATQAEIAACVSAAVNGDMIRVPAGSATWSSPVTINGKAITVRGGWTGADFNGTTTITASQAFYLTSNTTADVNMRITQFTIVTNSGGPTFRIDSDGGGEAPHGFRIDNIIRNNTSGSIIEFASGWGRSSSSWEGLIDHCTIQDGRIVYYGEESSTAGRFRWAEDDNLGTKKALYIEDNRFLTSNTSLSNSVNQIDGNWGSRTVVRFNTFNTGRIEQHSVQGQGGRAVRMWEFYYNDFSSPSTGGMYRYFFLRGGTGLAFYNRTDGRDTWKSFSIDNVRSHQWTTDSVVASSLGAWGGCTGSSVADTNESGGEGHLCLDQIGASKHSSVWNGSGQAPIQAKRPAYFWHNIRTDTGKDMGVSLNCVGTGTACIRQETKHLVQNQDWFTAVTPFNGTVGVGEGPLSARPATCTTGVGYWATDQGNWNTSASNPHGVQANGADGVLYRCISANSWSVNYTPYTYPHPLQSGGGSGGTGGTTPPPAPTNLTVQ